MADANHALAHWIGPTPVPTRGLDRFRLFKAAPEDASVKNAREALEKAGFVVHVASARPLRIVGGTASEGSRPTVYIDGFCVLAEDGRFVVSSTAAKGRAVDETSYATLQSAVDALVAAYGTSPPPSNAR